MLFLWNHITVSSAAAIRALSMKFPLSQILSLGDPNLSALGAPLEEQQLLKKPPVLLSPGPPAMDTTWTCPLVSQSNTRALGFGKYPTEIPSLQIFIFTTQRVKQPKMFSQLLQAKAIQEFWESSLEPRCWANNAGRGRRSAGSTHPPHLLGFPWRFIMDKSSSWKIVLLLLEQMDRNISHMTQILDGSTTNSRRERAGRTLNRP